MDQKQRVELRIKIGSVYKPGAPINKYDLFSGRQEQVRQIVDGLGQDGQHVVIFGERGVGKTSLSKVLLELLGDLGLEYLIPDNINCDSSDTFARIWHKAFRELSAYLNIRNIESSREIPFNLDELLYETPDDIRYALNVLPKPAIIVLDEVDRITDTEAPALLADTIKTLSDHASSVTLILIGVADSVDQLIQEHRSVERAIVQVHVPRMSPTELRGILEKGAAETGIQFDALVADRIVALSAGLPHYTHSLALHAARNAVEQDRYNVIDQDLEVAIRNAVDTPGPYLSAYERATASTQRQSLYSQVLLACALAEKSGLGFFTAASIKAPLERITGSKYEIPSFAAHLHAFCSEARGAALERQGAPRQFRYRFVNPLLQPFVIIHALSKGILDASELV